jgi:hypothetical protein
MMKRAHAGLLLVCGLVGGSSARACGACGCTLNSDWSSQGHAVGPGLRFDLRYDYFAQDQLRRGTRAVDRASFGLPAEEEVQEKTLNRNLTLTLDYSSGSDWGLTVQVPAFDRAHATVAEGDVDPSTSQVTGLGDIRVLGRYQGFSEEHALGIQVGLKLPTGGFHQTFAVGPQAGQPLDRGLQMGTGTTDLLIGAYAFGDLTQTWGCFAQVLLQKPLGEREGFKPGDGLNASAGVRYTGFRGITPHLQLNLRAEGRESGPQADAANSGATLVYLSPGVTLDLGRALQVYAFAQVPVAQRVTGLQLEPRWSLSLGLHWSL